MSWLEVSMTVNGELAEAVADVFARFSPNGVTTEQGVGFVHEEDEGTPSGPITVRAYLPVDGKLEETRQKLEESLFFLGMIQPLPQAKFTIVQDQNWMEAWKEHYHPIPIGKKLIIVPAWLKSPEKERIAIKIDPGMAFGTGTHPTTQLCLELIEEFFEERLRTTYQKPVSIIDIGCGSGILSIGALKSGAYLALGVDIDENSVKASRENAEANGIDPQDFSVGFGSVSEVREGRFAIKQAELVLANILAPVIIRLFEKGLADLAEPGGRLIVSGILEDQAGPVRTAGEIHNMKFIKQKQFGDWIALEFQSIVPE